MRLGAIGSCRLSVPSLFFVDRSPRPSSSSSCPEASLEMSRYYSVGVLFCVAASLLFGSWTRQVVNLPEGDSGVRTTQKSHEAQSRELFDHPEPVCRGLQEYFQSSMLSTQSIWNVLHDDILNITIASEPQAADWIKERFEWHTPQRLERGVDTVDFRPVLRKLGHPFHVAVLGGSITAGNLCQQTPPDLPLKFPKGDPLRCAWTTRWAFFINELLRHILGMENAVLISNLGIGGATSDIGSMMLDYQLFPKDLPPIDMIVYGYAANDSRGSREQADVNIPTFIRKALNYNCSNETVVAVVEDIFGIRRGSKRTLETSDQLAAYARWYQVPLWSYADVAREGYYPHINAEQAPLAGSEWGLHMGFGFHFGMAWSLTYAFLHAVVETCNADPALYVDDTEWPVRKMPDRHTRYTSVPAEWKKNRDASCIPQKCAYSWLVNRFVPKQVDDAMAAFLLSVDGWKATGDPIRQPRTGYYAQHVNATFTMRFPAWGEDARQLTLTTLHSDQPEFDSDMEVSMILGNEAVWTQQISAHHDDRSSIHLPHKYELPRTDSSFDLTFRVVRGRQFKIAGMALCRN